MKTLNYQKLLENPLFVSRYIEPNINWRHSYLNGKRGIKRLFSYPYASLMRKFFLRSYFQKRVLRGILDIPYVEIVLTTKCTLRCEHCCNLMQYFTPKAQYVGTLENIIESLEQLCSKVSSINRLRLIGGEPFLFKDLPQLLDYIESQKKILTYDILSNGSIDIKEPILQRMKKSKKIRKVSISDYSHVPNIRLKQESIFKNLKKYRIPFSFLKGGTWHRLERIHKRGRSKEQIIANYLSCRASCVSLIGGGGGKIAPKGAMKCYE